MMKLSMTLQIALPPELQLRLHREAERRGISEDAATLRILDAQLPPLDQRQETMALLQSWIDSDEDDEADDNYDLFKAMDEARTSNRPLFPEELKGASW